MIVVQKHRDNDYVNFVWSYDLFLDRLEDMVSWYENGGTSDKGIWNEGSYQVKIILMGKL